MCWAACEQVALQSQTAALAFRKVMCGLSLDTDPLLSGRWRNLTFLSSHFWLLLGQPDPVSWPSSSSTCPSFREKVAMQKFSWMILVSCGTPFAESVQDSNTSAIVQLSFKGVGDFHALGFDNDIILAPRKAPRVCFSSDTHRVLDCPTPSLNIVRWVFSNTEQIYIPRKAKSRCWNIRSSFRYQPVKINPSFPGDGFLLHEFYVINRPKDVKEILMVVIKLNEMKVPRIVPGS